MSGVSAEYLRHVVERLESFGSHPLGFRVAGTPEEREATAFIASEMRDAGLVDVVEEPVPVDAWRLEDAYVELDDGVRFECASFGGVPETPQAASPRSSSSSAEAAGGSSTGSTSAGRSRSSTGKSRGSGHITSAWSSACEALPQ